eukprot:881366-Rhodomonas_salina.1
MPSVGEMGWGGTGWVSDSGRARDDCEVDVEYDIGGGDVRRGVDDGDGSGAPQDDGTVERGGERDGLWGRGGPVTV